MALDTNLIFQAADALAAEGKRVSVRAVYEKIGETHKVRGTFKDYLEPLRIWRGRQQSDQASRAVEIPEVVLKRMQVVFAEIWSASMAEANAQLEAQRQALDEERAVMQAEQAEIEDAAQALASQVEQLQATHQELSSQLDRSLASAAQANAELQAARVQIAELTAQKASAEERIASVTAELNRSLIAEERHYEESRQGRLEIEKLRKTGDDLKTRALVAEGAQHSLSERLKTLQKDYETAAADARAARDEAAALRGQVAMLKEQLIGTDEQEGKAPRKPAAKKD